MLISDVRPIQIATTVQRAPTPPRHGGAGAGSARPNPGDSTSGESYARSPGRQAAVHRARPDLSVMPFEDLPGPWVAFRATLLGPCGWNLPANAGLVSAKEGPPCPGGTRAGGTRPWKPQVMPSLHDNNTSGLVARRRSRQRHHPTPLRLVPNTKGIAASPRQGNHNRPSLGILASGRYPLPGGRRRLAAAFRSRSGAGLKPSAAGNDAANTLQSSAPSPRERLPAPAQDGIPAWSALISAAHGHGGLGSSGMVTPGNAGLFSPPRRGQEPGSWATLLPHQGRRECRSHGDSPRHWQDHATS